jgi:small GTP-binding protein
MGRIFGRKGILSDREQELRAREQELLERLAGAVESFEPALAATDLRRLREAREQLDGLFLLVVAGEFNSGKSSFINALLGEQVLPEGVTPTTDRITVLRYGDQPAEKDLEAFLLERTHPSPLLRELSIVDTPGTNAIIRRHEELTREYVPRSDLVLFVTSADRPFTESERAFLEQIREWGKKIVFVINKIDILQDEDERKQVADFVRENATTLLGQPPEVFPVSARQALGARASGNEEARPALWEASGFGAMEEYLLHTLDQEERIRLKLLNPLNVGLRLAATYKETAFERLKLLADDVETIDNIDRQLTSFHEEMVRDFEPRLDRLRLVLGEMGRRGESFFDEHIRIGRIKGLLKSDTIRQAFAKEVVGDTPRVIEEDVGRIIDWIVERNLKVWQDVDGYIDRRKIARHREEIMGEVGRTFNYNRQALLDSIGRQAREVLNTYDREAEARLIANEVQGTFATTALAEIGAIGLGTVVATVAMGAAADITGILLATVLAVGGFYLIPRKRRKAKDALRKRLATMEEQLIGALTRQVNLEIQQSTERVNEAIAPYRRFVVSQQERLNEARGELVATEDSLLRLKREIEGR